MTLFCIVSILLSADIRPDNLLTPATAVELCSPPTRDKEEVGVSDN